jgi:hypothetical protein
MNTLEPYTEEQWYAMCDMRIGKPIPLAGADLTSHPWVYWREWGLMYVPSGFHQGAMAVLYVFTKGFTNYVGAAIDMNIPTYRACETFAEKFLMELPGTAFKSSVGSRGITVGRLSNLTAIERRIFTDAGLNITPIE